MVQATQISTPASEAANTATLEVINSIMANEKTAARFFYKEMKPGMAALANGYNHAYGLDLKAEDVSHIAYLACWENDWARLRACKGNTSAHAWVTLIASQATYRMLVEEKQIGVSRGSRVGDYRLRVRSISNPDLRQAIVDLVYTPRQHEVLEMYYVSKADLKCIAAALNENEDQAVTLLHNAEKTLIERLLNTENPFADLALVSKNAPDPEMKWLQMFDRIDEADVCDNRLALRELLSVSYGCDDWDRNVETFVGMMISKMKWTPVQTELFHERFFNSTPSKVLADRFSMRTSWVDNTYMRLSRQFQSAVRSWWNANN